MAALPVLLVVDPDPDQLAALAAALERRYSRDYTVLASGAAGEALAELEELKASAEVALLIAPEAAGDLEGVEFLARASSMYPTAKRILLVERGFPSGTPITRAMTLGLVDYHLSRPWRPERTLYPAIDEFLAEWVRSQGSRREPPVLRVVADWEAGHGRDLRELLSRTGMPFELHDASSEQGGRLLTAAGLAAAERPVLLFADGRTIVDPDPAEVVRALGGEARPAARDYDLVVLGAGPAGLAAAVYGASEGLSTVVLEPLVFGGQAASSSRIRNYLGFPRGLRGDELAYRAVEQAWLFGAELVFSQAAVALAAAGGRRVVRLAGGDELRARAVILAIGARWRRLDVPSLEGLLGRGVFYGAGRVDIEAMGGQDVVLVGGGNSAGQAALALAERATSVTMAIRGDSLARSMSTYLVSQIEATGNIAVRTHSQVVDAVGGGRLEALTLRDERGGGDEQVRAAAVFIMIGAEPQTEWLAGTVALDDGGFVLTGNDLVGAGLWQLERPPYLLETSMPGVFAAGDVRHGSAKRVAAAVGEGATAVQLLHAYLAEART